MQTDYLGGERIETIYFGGGTPSALPVEDIGVLMEAIDKVHVVDPRAEVTLEANPDDISDEQIKHWRSAGINRLSIGIQAFQDELLTAWNRSHSSEQAMRAIAIAQQGGIVNITADLIYGGPGLTDEMWKGNIQRLLDAGIPHISSYALTVEAGTALSHHIDKGKSISPDDDQANRQYAILQDILAANGILQYEVSNFAKPGFESRHNQSYWSGAHYLGIGPSAHSYDGVSRQWNVAHNVRYIQALAEGTIPFEREELTVTQQFNELVMTGLRTSRGIDTARIGALGEKYVDDLEKHIVAYVEKGQVERNGIGNWVLKPEYLFFADGIAADLFVEGGDGS
jgi:putative oxygen-independent coproporphyrinogen III oxidase